MPKKTSTILLFLTLLSCSSLFDPCKSEIDGVYIPKNLDEAILEVDKFYSYSLKTEIKKLDEDDFGIEYHFVTGIKIRNNWALWTGSRLSKFFNRSGINNPDDMSRIILTSYHRKLTGNPINFRMQVSEYKEYWKELKKLHKHARLPRKSKYPSDSLELEYIMWIEKENKPSLLHLQTNSKNDSLWIYEYQHGWKKINEETAKKLKHPRHKTDSILKIIYTH